MGYLASVVGLSGSGKSTAIRNASSVLIERGLDVASFHDRKADPISRRINSIIQSRGISPEARHFLFLAARRQIIDEQIIPALQQNDIVFTDRYFPCSIAYQSYGEGLDLNMVTRTAVDATTGAKPDSVFFLDIPVLESRRRMKLRDEIPQALETEKVAFYEQVRQGYLEQAEGRTDYLVIDGTMPRIDVAKSIASIVLTDLGVQTV